MLTVFAHVMAGTNNAADASYLTSQEAMQMP